MRLSHFSQPSIAIFDIGRGERVSHIGRMSQPDLTYRLRQWLELQVKESGKTQAELASFLGVAPSAISRIFNGGRQISATELIMLTEFLGISFRDIDTALNDEVDIQHEIQVAAGLKARADNKLISVPNNLYSERILAFEDGGIPMMLPKEVFGMQKYRDDYLRWIGVPDESMSPLFEPGDFVIIDASVRTPLWPGVYALGMGDGRTALRRVEVESFNTDLHPEAQVSVSPENPKFRGYIVSLDQLTVVGRCIVKLSSRMV